MSTFISSVGFGLVTAGILALGAVGFTLQFGVSNLFNLAYASTMTLSAFVAYVILHDANINPWAALAIAGIAGSTLSVASYAGLYRPFLRKGTGAFALVMVTLSVALVITYVTELIFGPGSYSMSFGLGNEVKVGALIWTQLQVVMMFITVGVVVVLYLLLRYTKSGRALRATANDQTLARTCGIDTRKVQLAVWAVSGFLCGVCGVEFVLNSATFDFQSNVNFLLLVFAAAALGGVGEIYGAVVGAVVIGIATALTAIILPALQSVGALALLLIVMLLRPQGLFGSSASLDEDIGRY